MMNEMLLGNGWSLRFFTSGCQSIDHHEMGRLTDSVIFLNLQSEYAPSQQNTAEFIAKIFCGNEPSAEKNLLGILISPDLKTRGYLQTRYFDGSADLDFLLIDSGLRRQGFARVMMENMHRLVQEAGMAKVLLEVGVTNQSAIGLYQQLGYRKISIRRSYYRSGEDALVMEKVL